MRGTEPLRICVCAPRSDAYSETFIRDHIRLLPAATTILGDALPALRCDGRAVLPRAMRLPLRRGWGSRPASALIKLAHRQIIRILRARQVDVLLAEFAPTAFLYLDICRAARIPLVVHFHGYDVYRRDLLERHAGEYRRLFHEAAGMIVGSRAMQRHLAQLAGTDERIHYNPCGVETDCFPPAEPAGNPPVFVAVGRFVEKKAPHLTLLAFREVLRAQPLARLLMIGDGPLLDACRQMARVLGLENAVRFCGVQRPEQVGAALRGGRAFVQHSVTAPSGDSEGTAVSILEAAASGLPVISTRHGGIQDTMIDGETAYLVDEYDVSAMAQCMIRVAEHPELAARLGAAARRRVLEQFSMARSISGLSGVLEKTVKSSGAKP